MLHVATVHYRSPRWIAIQTEHLRRHIPGPLGVRGRNSDNSKLRRVLGWEPETPLREGLIVTYDWIRAQVGG